MGDRCYLEITMRRTDLPRFTVILDAEPDEEWWDDQDDVEDHPDLVNCTVHEANYAWYDERQAAAKAGLPFYGSHGEGGEYGPYAFAALDGEQLEAPLTHEGHMFIAVNDDLTPLVGIDNLRAYAAKLKAVKQLFGMEVHDGEPSADQQEERQAVPAGLRAA